jgi:hypothetical protein
MTVRSKFFAVLAAAIVSLGMLTVHAAPASAHQVYTRCDEDGDRCWRVICDDDGDDCHPIRHGGYYAYREHPRWVCDEDGDDCHWVTPRYHDEAVPGAFFGFRFHN